VSERRKKRQAGTKASTRLQGEGELEDPLLLSTPKDSSVLLGERPPRIADEKKERRIVLSSKKIDGHLSKGREKGGRAILSEKVISLINRTMGSLAGNKEKTILVFGHQVSGAGTRREGKGGDNHRNWDSRGKNEGRPTRSVSTKARSTQPP